MKLSFLLMSMAVVAGLSACERKQTDEVPPVIIEPAPAPPPIVVVPSPEPTPLVTPTPTPTPMPDSPATDLSPTPKP